VKKHRFILGIGSQRAGSTLLHRLLERSTAVFMHPLKELHYFDTLYGYRSREALKKYSLSQISREINRIVDAKNHQFIDEHYRCYLRTNKILAWNEIEQIGYKDLFRPFLRGFDLLGEVTPEYMLLNEEALLQMKQVVGEDAGIILVCRNPVDRLLSAAKLFNVYNNLKMDSTTANQWLRQQIDTRSPWMQAQEAYNDYAGAIGRYSRHFPHFIALSYEAMIADPRITARQLADTLHIKVDESAFAQGVSHVVNDLGDNLEWSEENRALLQARYASA
jgi:hypothetical protein